MKMPATVCSFARTSTAARARHVAPHVQRSAGVFPMRQKGPPNVVAGRPFLANGTDGSSAIQKSLSVGRLLHSKATPEFLRVVLISCSNVFEIDHRREIDHRLMLGEEAGSFLHHTFPIGLGQPDALKIIGICAEKGLHRLPL